jgi:carboxymethylenebutenolidase
MGEMVEFAGGDEPGVGYLATPEQGAGIGIIVIQEWWGLVDHIRDVCDRFAAEGFTALAPDLYHGETTDAPDDAGRRMMALRMDRAAAELGGAVDLLLASDAVRGDGVGVTGFCMGGGLSLVLAAQRPDAVRACVPFYGLIPWPEAQPDWSRLEAPVLGHYAEDDRWCTPDAVAELQRTLDGHGKDAELIVYPGVGHAFFNDDRPAAYDATAASVAWTRTLEFLRAKLG